MKFYFKLVLVITLLTGIVRWQSWFVPFNRDEGGYAYVAAQLFQPGFVMYRDAFEHKPPLIDLIYAIAFKLFGQTDFAVHTLAFLFSSLTAALFFFIVKENTHKLKLALVACGLFILFSNTFFLSGNGSNVEIFLSPILVLSYWLLSKQKSFWAGILLGIAMVLKPVVITNIGLAYIFLTFAKKDFLSTRVKFTLGWTIPVIVMFAYEWSTGAFSDFFKAVFGFNLFYVQYGVERIPYNDNLFRVLIFPDPVLVILFFGTILLLIKDRFNQVKNWKSICWAFAIVLGVKVLSREADHYYIPLLPALGLILVKLPQKLTKRLLVIAAILYACMYLRLEIFRPKTALIQALGAEQLQRYDARDIGLQAKRLIHEGDVGHVSLVAEPELLFYAGIASANRYFNTFAIDFYPDGRQTIVNTLDKKPIVVMAYPGIIPGFEEKVVSMGYKKDHHSYFAPVYWRADAASGLGL